MINYELLEKNFATLKKSYQSASPYPWCLMHDFLLPGYCEELAGGFPETLSRAQKDPFAAKKHLDVARKIGTSNLDIMTEVQREFFKEINSARFISFLSRMTGVEPLYQDEGLSGSGLHEIYPGGYLNLHADFNFHPKNKTLRKLNLILYLNKEWSPKWNGQLELWPSDLDESGRVLIEPLINHAAIFETSETSWHGHPDPLLCPEGVTRKSLAIYYYTTWPKDLTERPKTLYVLTPRQSLTLEELMRSKFHEIKSEEELKVMFDNYQYPHVKKAYKKLRAQMEGQTKNI